MIEVKGLYKTFKLYHSPAERLKEIVLRKEYHRKFHALQDVIFEVNAGETLGIIGQNGAGKSTLLKVLTGILLPDSGTIRVDGKITGLLELGTGFNSEFTGLQNIYLNGTLLGMSRGDINQKLDGIIEFAELGDFISEPLKTYSSGMAMRLAFSVAIHADPKAFVVDEALSVGDAYFQQKCMKKIRQFKEQGGSIVFVSHDMNSVKVLCDKALLLDHGKVVEDGDPDKVVNGYNLLLARKAAGKEFVVEGGAIQGQAYGNFQVEILRVEMLNGGDMESHVFVSGEPCSIAVILKANEDIEDVTVGILIRDRFGQDIFGTNTYHLKLPLEMSRGAMCKMKFCIDELNLGSGKYTLTVAAHRDDVHLNGCYHWIDLVKSFEVLGSKDFAFVGLNRLKTQVQMELT